MDISIQAPFLIVKHRWTPDEVDQFEVYEVPANAQDRFNKSGIIASLLKTFASFESGVYDEHYAEVRAQVQQWLYDTGRHQQTVIWTESYNPIFAIGQD